MQRRDFVISGLAGVIAGTAKASNQTLASKPSAKPGAPALFLWGTAGAAYQIEGSSVASDLWVLEHVQPTIFPTPSGDACDAYNRVAGDIALAARLGFNAHWMSIKWSRIEPEPGQISSAGLPYSSGVLETCRAHGLSPAVTLTHVSVPRWVASSGGFVNPANVAAFARHCGRVTKAMGDLITLAATFNEPNARTLAVWGGYIDQALSQIKAMQTVVRATTNSPNWVSPMVGGEEQYDGIIAAHTAAIEAIRSAGGKFPVGRALAVTADDAVGGNEDGLARKRSEMLDRWLAAPGDFIGVQTYTGFSVGAKNDLPTRPGVELTQMHYPFMPEAIEVAVRLVASRTPKPIYITENGVATEDDARRIAFIRKAVAGVQRCRQNGIDVRG